MPESGGVFARLGQPEYTGENRCLPCTVVNGIIAALAGAFVAAVGAWLGSPLLGAATGGAVVVFSAGAIYLRGYLVPGTPTLTKRYLPERVLRWFGKEPLAGTAPGTTARAPSGEFGREAVDPERVLLDVGALEECQAGEDLCLAAEFRTTWYAEIERVEAADADRERLLELLDLDGAGVTFREYGDAFTALVDDRTVGTWESRGAFLADLGAATILADRLDDWSDLSVAARSQLLGGLRLFVDECPRCGGAPAFDTETVASCCSTHEVAAVECEDCGARLFESSPM